MVSKKIGKPDIAKLMTQWSQELLILVPSRENESSRMARWDGKDTGFLDWYRNTIMPAKACLFPPVEEMFRFHKDEDSYQLEVTSPDKQKQLIFGIRPCDARAMAILDRTFADAYEDRYYLSRRRNTLLVGLGCTNPGEACFCTSLGSGPSDATDVDIMFTDLGEELMIEAVTEAGKKLLARTKELTTATKTDIARAEKVNEAAIRKVTRKIKTEGIADKLLASFENEQYWDKVAAKCISCGICTLLCPTCYCFDINDEILKRQGSRFRSWDSCGFGVYTRMPMENPRGEKWRRVRQKVCHKYEFYPMNFDVIACTGCGRCLRLCPVNWDITQILSSVPDDSLTKV